MAQTTDTTGKCGHAYFVPHFTSSGYSGNVVEVDLHTDALGSVRLHGVVTDFADFYASGGVGPYDGQVPDVQLCSCSARSEGTRLHPRRHHASLRQQFFDDVVCLLLAAHRPALYRRGMFVGSLQAGALHALLRCTA